MELLFDHGDESDFMMTENQAVALIDEHSDKVRELVAKGNAGNAGGYAVLVVKIARHLEWVRNCCPMLKGDGAEFHQWIEQLRAAKIAGREIDAKTGSTE
jgi:hypothetical protein